MFKHAAVGDERGYLVSDDEDGEEGGSDENEGESAVGIRGGSEKEKRVVRKEQVSGVRRQLDFNEIQNVIFVDSDDK